MIKYRVWDNTEQKYDYDGYSIGCDGKLYKSGGVVELAKDYIIEQYTGLKDKNGVEIYEGDIAQVKTGLVGKVVYSNKYACFEIVGPGFPPYSFAELADATIDIDGMVVIGNIHEDGELLEEKQ